MLLMTLVFLWSHYLSGLAGHLAARLIFFPGNHAPWTVLTALLLHGGWLHLLGNLIYLFVFGPLLEDRLGRWRFLAMFFMLGAGGNLAHGLVATAGWFQMAGVGVMGASGAISGLLALTLVRFHFARVSLAYWVFAPLQGVNRAGRAYLPVPLAMLLWLLLQVVQGLVASESGAAVAYAAHLGGFGLGLILALILGYHRQAVAEQRLVAGRRFLERGEGYAAEGAFLEYLRQAPKDLEGHLLLARARRMTGRRGAARQDYRAAFHQALAGNQVNEALQIYQEARRGDPILGLSADELARAAFLLEKQLDFQGAAETYVDLYTLYPTSERAELALVRAIMLFQSKLRNRQQARHWMAVAWQELKPGVWRDFLAQEFGLERTPSGAAPAEGGGFRPEPAI
jgi:membrane associated rhomboid family serine protease